MSDYQKQIYRNCKFKKYGIVSVALFSIIIISGLLLENLILKDFNAFIYFIITCAGTIGLVYCFMLLRELNDKIDYNILNHYSDLLDSPDSGARKI